MRLRVVPAVEFMPDQPNYGNSVLVAENVIPWKNGYKAFPTFSAITAAIAERAQGFISLRDFTGTPYNFTGTASKLYQYTIGTTMTDVSRTAGGVYTTATEG